MNLNFNTTIDLKKFNLQLNHIQQQLSGDIKLDIPDIIIDDPKDAAKDEQIVQRLMLALESWVRTIQQTLESVQDKTKETIQYDGPLAEIEEWRRRNAALSTIYEQLERKNVKNMIEVLRIYDEQLLPAFEDQFNELTKLYMEAKVRCC